MDALSTATAIIQTLQRAGHIAYFAGGWVRDYLMQHPSDDIDIATSASVKTVQRLFPKTVPVGISFGIIIVIENSHPFEVATFRKEAGYRDGRRPQEIYPATPAEDAQRRDFTINGMFYDPVQKQLFDFVGGVQDIGAKVIRAIGDPVERFLEDRLRMMRAVRYATRFGFSIDQATWNAILEHASSLLPAVAMERIWQEFRKMAQFAHFDMGLAAMHKLSLLPTIFPTLQGVSIGEIEKRLAPITRFPKNAPPLAELLQLFPDSSLATLLTLCDTLKLSKDERAFAQQFHSAMALLKMPLDWQEKLESIEWAQFYAKPHTDMCLGIFAAHLSEKDREIFHTAHNIRKRQLAPFVCRIREKRPLIRANDLVALGVLPGPEMGRLLVEAERISINCFSEDKTFVLQQLTKHV